MTAEHRLKIYNTFNVLKHAGIKYRDAVKLIGCSTATIHSIIKNKSCPQCSSYMYFNAKLCTICNLKVGYRKGIKHTEESKKKMSDSAMGRIMSDETRNKLSESKQGDKHPQYIDGRCQDKQYVSWLKNKRNRTLRKLIQDGLTHTYEEWTDVLDKHNNKCANCGSNERLTIDHIIPLSKGGTDLVDNLQPLCLSCNCKKSAKYNKPNQ